MTPKKLPTIAPDPADEIATLVRQLLATEQRLQELTGGEVDSILEAGGRSYLLTQAQEKLRESEAEFRTLANAVPQIIWITNPDGGSIYFNEPWTEYTGLTFAESLGHGWSKPFHADDQQRALDSWQSATANLAIYSLECRLRRADGEYRWWLVRGVPQQDFAGNIVRWIVSGTDIHDIKLAQASLRLLNSAVLQAKDSVVITEAQLDLPGPKIVFVNPAFTEMTGYTAVEVIGKTPRILQGTNTDKTEMGRLRQYLGRGETFEGEAINYRKDGREINVEWQITPLRDGSGAITHFVAIQRDITAQKKLEQQFRQAQKMESFGQLAGGVAHDFNNILMVIQLQAEIFKDDNRLTPEQLDCAEAITTAAQRAADLTRQLLLFSRKEAMRPRDLDLSQSINGVNKMLRRILGEDIQFQFKPSPEPLFVHADTGMLDQVLMNLAVNSRDAMPNGGKLVIETSAADIDVAAGPPSAQNQAGSFICLSVSDTGCGIPPENLSRIFEPFFTTKDVGKGTGLGLATVFGIVQQHNGWIKVYSEVGIGTTFRIYLPRLIKPPSSQQKAEPVKLANLRGGDETLLLVEDDDFVRPAICNALSRLGYRVLAVSNGLEALDAWQLRRDQIDLLVTDLVMPGSINGKDLGECLLRANPKLKVVYASGYSAEIVGKDFHLEEGVNFLTKPFELQKLARTIRDRLDKPGQTIPELASD